MKKETSGTKRIVVDVAIIVMMTAMMLAFMILIGGRTRTIRYSLYPYLPDTDYYGAILEEEWAKIHPDVKLEYVPYDCYFGGGPEGIDVIMYDAILEREYIEKGYLKPLDLSALPGRDDFFAFTLEPAAGYTENYGVPVFLCSDFMIYDRDNEALAAADDIFDLAKPGGSLLISFGMYGDKVYLMDAAADTVQDGDIVQDKDRVAGVNVSESKRALAEAALPEYVDCRSNDIAVFYDMGVADGYLGYPETMRLIEKRIDRTAIKQIGIGANSNVPLFYCDMVGIASDVPDGRVGLCMDLIGLMTDPAVMKRVSVKDGVPQYLMFSRRSFYEEMEREYPIYTMLKDLAANEDNRLFRAYGTFMDENYR